MKIVLLIRQLEVGGAETQLCNLAEGLVGNGHDVIIVTFYPGGGLEARIVESGIRICSLMKKSRWQWLRPAIEFYRIISSKEPDVIYSFLSGPNLFALIGRLCSRRVKVFWGVRTAASDTKIRPNDTFVAILFRITLYLSSLTERILVNSHSAQESLLGQGISEHKIAVIPNGVDTKQFCFQPQIGSAYRSNNDLSKNLFLAGMVARIDPVKNYEMFIEGAACFLSHYPNSKFLIVGSGDETYLRRLMVLVRDKGIDEKIIFLGEQKNIVEILNALDVFVLTSRTESFSNALAEALACGVPAIATSVGDSERIVGTSGVGIKPDCLSELVMNLRRLKEAEIGPAQRAKNAANFAKRFSVEKMVDSTMTYLTK
jgi:glycosyltransferase involved in cell wall biosynthesis